MEENKSSLKSGRIKILFLFRPTMGGIQSHIIDLIEYLDQSEYSIYTAGPYTDYFFKKATKAGADVIFLKIADKISFFEDIKAITKLRGILKRLTPDIIHIHGNKAGFIAYFACMGKKPKKIITFHNFQRLSKGNMIVKKISSFINRRFSKNANIIAVSNDLKNQLVETDGFDASSIHVIHNGIDTEKFKIDMNSRLNSRKELKIDKNEILVGFIGRFTEQKNPLLFINIADKLINKIVSEKKLRDIEKIRFLMVGDGPLKNDVINEIKNKGLTDRFTIINFVEDVRKLYFALDVFIFPSSFEPFGLVAIEALSCNVPVVASMVGGIPEIIENEKNGLLFKNGDTDDAVTKIINIIMNKDLRERFMSNGRELVIKDFSIKNMVEKTEKIYKMIE